MFLGMFGIILGVFLSLLPLGLPGGNQVDGLPPAASHEMRAVFRRFSNFYDISNHFSDFFGLDLMFAEAHARGFAPL